MKLDYTCSLLAGLGQIVSSTALQPSSGSHITSIGVAISFISFSQTSFASAVPPSYPLAIIPRRDGWGGYGSGGDDGFPYGGSNGGAGNSGSAFGDDGYFQNVQEWIRLRNAHAIIMSLTMLIMFPVGGLIMRVFGRWWLHAGWQAISALLLVAGFGVGVYLANETNTLFNNTHTILGTVVFALFLTAQPILGFVQHSYFKRNKQRGPAGHMHAWLGRIVMVLGIVNGGLGLKLAEEDGTPRQAYIIVAAIMGALYIVIMGITALMKRRRSKAPAVESTGAKLVTK